MSDSNQYFKLYDQVSHVQRDNGKLQSIVERIESTMEKFTSLSSDMTKILAVHESKIQTYDNFQNHVSDLMEIRRKENELKIDILNKEIHIMERDIKTLIDDQTKAILTGRKDIYETILNEIKEFSKTISAAVEKDRDSIYKKINNLERYFFIAAGVGLTILFAMQNITGIKNILGLE